MRWKQARVIGHRGRGRSGPDNPWPENTLPSFEAALAEGADMLELDVRLSADGTVVVVHDDTVDRTTDGSGSVHEKTKEALQALDAGGPTWLGEAVRIPGLGEVLEAVAVDLNVEIKVARGTSGSGREAMCRALLRCLAEDPRPHREVIVSSFDEETLVRLSRANRSPPLGLLTERAEEVPAAIASGRYLSIHLGDGAADRETLGRVRDARLLPLVWTVNDPERARALVAQGALGIITDHPAAIRGALAPA